MVVREGGGRTAQWLTYLLPDPAARRLISSVPKKCNWKKLSMLLRLINGTGKMKVDSGLKMLIKPI